MLAQKLLTLAAGVINKPSGVMVGRWPRAAAALGRQSIEAALADFWRKNEPSLAESSYRAQLLSLPVYHNDPQLAREVSSAWGQLSRACHYHPYELPPTQQELQYLLGVVSRFVA